MQGIVGRMGPDALTGSDREMPFRGRAVVGGYEGDTEAHNCTGLFVDKPAPTRTVLGPKAAQYLWERACPRRGQNRC
ncbi:hypothetical protein O999_20260 [Pseudomonas putida LF54]|uniref:Uncharacterized protein n=1 Tax=Pseudomonas putida TaxID=303 RepID=A0A1X1AD08_PSEPU|nr:hypothetical protein O999_20260 [Pseudomonas putida LF54]ORL69849.1 hypothetical protein B7H19_08010 [Pseudomonas putida]POF86185.1 hypothetical protein BGP81_27835 [Pseudomonas putida]POG00055.1 hypothetical protein BGP83_23265 [Pseudomonas putida]POG04465.1 hypothetical protein BGP82_24805 [Pseudomonas putida]